MSYSVPRAVVEAFYEAYAARDIDRIVPFLDEDVDWTISGPVDVLPFCGRHRGKQAVLDMMQRAVPEIFDIYRFVVDTMVIDGDRAATFNRLSARVGDGRVISYQLAHFMRFRAGKVVENLSLIDSFDAAEQVLGHSLAVEAGEGAEGEMVAV
jgi:ketosteroid isomerase-like protein